MSARTRRRLGGAIAICAALVIAVTTLMPSGPDSFVSDELCFICGDFGGVDALLNIALFVPLGVGLAMAGFRGTRAVPAMCLATLAIECLQISVIPGRDASVGDVLTNSVGGAIGFLIGARIDLLLRPSAGRAFALMVGWLCVWVSFQSVSGYALTPLPPASRYFGEITPELGGKPAYPGEVLRATVGGIPVPSHELDDSPAVRDALRQEEGAEVNVLLVPHGSSPEQLAIVRIADDKRREVLLVAGEGSGLVFGMHTGASALRLRPLLLAVPGVLPSDSLSGRGAVPDTIRIRARYSSSRIEMEASGAQHARAVSVSLSLGEAWRLVSPMSVPVDGSAGQSALDALWVFFCLAPAAFWASIAGGSSIRQFWLVISVLSGFVGAGLVLVPVIFHIAGAARAEILGAIAGLAAGALLDRVASSRRTRYFSRS